MIDEARQDGPHRPHKTPRDALIHDARENIEKLQHEMEALPAAIHQAVGDVPAAIRAAMDNAIANLEKCSEAQAYWIEQETLKDRDAFIAQQKEVNDSFVAAMKALIAVQNTALESVLLRTGLLTVEAIQKEVKSAVASVPRADNRTLVNAVIGVGIGLAVVICISAGVTLALYMQVS